MLGIPTLYLKIIGWVAAVGIIYGGYSYVTNQNLKIENLKLEKQQLSDMNDTLTESLAEAQRMQQIRDEVGAVSREIRAENRKVKEQNDNTINKSVQQGKDREVGPLLKEFFNAE